MYMYTSIHRYNPKAKHYNSQTVAIRVRLVLVPFDISIHVHVHVHVCNAASKQAIRLAQIQTAACKITSRSLLRHITTYLVPGCEVDTEASRALERKTLEEQPKTKKPPPVYHMQS